MQRINEVLICNGKLKFLYENKGPTVMISFRLDFRRNFL